MSSTTFKRYLFEYRYERATWGIEIHATSPEDARDRIKALGWAEYKGEIFATVPIANWFFRLFGRSS